MVFNDTSIEQGFDVKNGRAIPLAWYGYWSPFDNGLNHSIAFTDLVLDALARVGDPLNRVVEDKVMAFQDIFRSSLRVRADKRKNLPILPEEQWLRDSDVEVIALVIELDMCMWKATGGNRAILTIPCCPPLGRWCRSPRVTLAFWATGLRLEGKVLKKRMR
jgi:hypothetical protein